MKLKGEFILREMAGDKILVPVGQTALQFNGIIVLQPVAALIWEGLAEGLDELQLLERILERFDVEREEAQEDLKGFLTQLRSNGFLE